VLWKGSERRIGKVRRVKEKRFGKIEMTAMIFIFALRFCLGFCAVVHFASPDRAHRISFLSKCSSFGSDLDIRHSTPQSSV